MNNNTISDRITPTMHFTSYIWHKHRLGDDALTTSYGKKLYRYIRPLDFAYQLLTRSAGLESMLLERHRRIDLGLTEAIEHEGYEQIVEVASGLSARGLRFCDKYPSIRYIETDLANAIKLKEKLLASSDTKPNHEFMALNLLSSQDWELLRTRLNPNKKTLVISEGILGYLKPDEVLFFWSKISSLLQALPAGKYIADYRLDENKKRHKPQSLSKSLLGIFVKGKINFEFDFYAQLEAGLKASGFKSVDLIPSKKFPKLKNQVFKAQV